MNYLKHLWFKDIGEFKMKMSFFMHFLHSSTFCITWASSHGYVTRITIATITWRTKGPTLVMLLIIARLWKIHNNILHTLHKFCLVPVVQNEILEWDKLQTLIFKFHINTGIQYHKF